jgi:hypothetical protein
VLKIVYSKKLQNKNYNDNDNEKLLIPKIEPKSESDIITEEPLTSYIDKKALENKMNNLKDKIEGMIDKLKSSSLSSIVSDPVYIKKEPDQQNKNSNKKQHVIKTIKKKTRRT